MDKLGALPIAIALFLQFKSFRWPPDISWPEFFLGLVLAWMYWNCLLSIGLQFRAQAFQILLKRAMEHGSKQAPAATATDARMVNAA